MINIIRINELPEGSGNLTSDDIFLFMDDPSGSGITKQISLSQIAAAIGSSSSNESLSLVTNVFNKTGSPIPKMTAVYINGGQGDQPTISLAQANGESTSSKTYGLTAETIGNMSAGKVIVFGALTGLNTDQFNPTAPHGDVNGTTLYLSPTVAGGLTTTKPSAPNHMVAIGTIIRTHQNQGIIEVRVQNGFELEELHNVAISGVVDGQFLQYDSDNSLWIPGSIDTDLTGGPGIALSYDNINDALSIYSNGENYITDLGSLSGSNPIHYDPTTKSIQTLTLNGTATTFTKGTGWPTSPNVSVDTVLKINVNSPTTITWTIVNDWFYQPPSGALPSGVHLVLLRAMGSSVIEGHYIGNKTN